MKIVRKANDRGHLNLGWLEAYYTFSFGHYYDPKFMGVSNLRVINDDIIDEGMGFGTHPHKNMEIITFIKKGALKHEDTLGNSSIIRPGEIQVMSAGSGIEHSEFNPSQDEKTQSYQIWIAPKVSGVTPKYEQHSYLDRKRVNGLTLLVSPEGGDGVAQIHADSKLSLGSYEAGQARELKLSRQKTYWAQIIEGDLIVNKSKLTSGDGMAISDEDKLHIECSQNSEFLFFELP